LVFDCVQFATAVLKWAGERPAGDRDVNDALEDPTGDPGGVFLFYSRKHGFPVLQQKTDPQEKKEKVVSH
jgi:hypothetical protein